jgi:hypothetical protein
MKRKIVKVRSRGNNEKEVEEEEGVLSGKRTVDLKKTVIVLCEVELSAGLGIIVIPKHVHLLLFHYKLAHDETCVVATWLGTACVGAHVIPVMKSSILIVLTVFTKARTYRHVET